MTKREQFLVNKFFLSMVKSNQKRLVSGRRFRKNSRMAEVVVIPLKTVIKHWKTMRETLEAEGSVRPLVKRRKR